MELKEKLLELIIRTSSEIPEDVECALKKAAGRAEEGSVEATTLETILHNCELARTRRLPICQDTGTLFFSVEAAADLSRDAFQCAAEDAIREATAMGLLRQNCVNPLTGHNTGNNLGVGAPVIHWQPSRDGVSHVSLLLKGGGSENMGRQYSLPDKDLGANRDLDGVRRCLLDAVWRAQGQGCAPGILGVCIGGDRVTGFEESKLQLLRPLNVRSDVAELAELEERVLSEANSLGIGPMGCGGRTTLLDVHIGWRCRHPACYFVSISYLCWCCRRHSINL